MSLPTEPIGSIPRTPALIMAMQAFGAGRISQADLERVGEEAVGDTIAAFEATGSPVITDGEQTKSSFATYPLTGLTNLAPDGRERAVAVGEDIRAGRWWWEDEAAKECGLHVERPATSSINASALTS